MQNPKTNFIGYLLLSVVFIGLLLVAFGRATLSEAGSIIGPIFSVLTGIGFLTAKDGRHE